MNDQAHDHSKGEKTAVTYPTVYMAKSVEVSLGGQLGSSCSLSLTYSEMTL